MHLAGSEIWPGMIVEQFPAARRSTKVWVPVPSRLLISRQAEGRRIPGQNMYVHFSALPLQAVIPRSQPYRPAPRPSQKASVELSNALVENSPQRSSLHSKMSSIQAINLSKSSHSATLAGTVGAFAILLTFGSIAGRTSEQSPI